MDADGSFSLKNLGKSSIFLNGREIATGELLSFASSNLIEVNGFPYLTPDLVELIFQPLNIVPCSMLSRACFLVLVQVFCFILQFLLSHILPNFVPAIGFVFLVFDNQLLYRILQSAD